MRVCIYVYIHSCVHMYKVYKLTCIRMCVYMRVCVHRYRLANGRLRFTVTFRGANFIKNRIIY